MLRSAAGATEALAGDRERGLHRLASARDVARPRAGGREPRQFLHRISKPTWRGARHRSVSWRGAGIVFIEADIVDADACRQRVPGSRYRAARGGARFGPAIDRGSAAHARRQRDRIPQHAGGGARCGLRALRLCSVELDLRRPSRSAEGRGCDRPAAVAVRGDQIPGRALCPGVRPLLRGRRDGTALFQRIRSAPGCRGRVCSGDPALGGGDAVRDADNDLRRRRDDARFLLRRQRRAGQSAGCDGARGDRFGRRSTTSLSAGAYRSTICTQRCATWSQSGIRACVSRRRSTAIFAPATCGTRRPTSARRSGHSATRRRTRCMRA